MEYYLQLDFSRTRVLIDQAAPWFQSGSCLTDQVAAWFLYFLIFSSLTCINPANYEGPLAGLPELHKGLEEGGGQICPSIKKHRKSCEKLPWELVGCQGVKLFLLKDVILTTAVTTVILLLSQFEFLSHQNYFFFILHNLSFWVWLQFDLSSFVTICFFDFCHSLSTWVLPHFFFLVL